MGRYVNPNNSGFATIVNKEYVDKTGLVSLFDATLNTPNKLVLVSRPRRFGKSFAAKMLVAFYSCACRSRELFNGLAISANPNWDKNLNNYNVISLDMTGITQSIDIEEIVNEITRLLLAELREIVPNAGMRDEGHGNVLFSAIMDVVNRTKRKFVFIIDEWDAPYRLAQNNRAAQTMYANWLRAVFKDSTFTDQTIAGAYLTGILPIKKYAHQSAVSDFQEYTMIDPGAYASFSGFTEREVSSLCVRHGMDFDEVKRWYDGYSLRGADHLFAPFSVMRACERGVTGSYWVTTETYESLRPYIEMDFDGLQTDIIRAVGGRSLRMNPTTFQNDMVSIKGKDDVLTLFVHLGYLTYDADSGMARVPNDEVRAELARTIAKSKHPKLVALMQESALLLDDVVALREREVATGIERVHNRDCTPLFYNNEQALRSVVKSSLVSAIDDYARIEELPSGKGYADVAYIPKRGSMLPALLIELKWNKPVKAAITQIHEKGYPSVLQDLNVPILLVGVTYDAKTHAHRCSIEVLDED